MTASCRVCVGSFVLRPVTYMRYAADCVFVG